MKKGDKDKSQTPLQGPFNNPFGSLGGLKSQLPSAPASGEKSPASQPAAKAARKGPARAVVRMERKGRGGKEVTVVEQLALPARELEAWLKALKQSLGCGGAVEEGTLVVQGDHRERVRNWLEGRGVQKVSVG